MRFSVIIPNYNGEKWTEKCIKSILSQTFKDYEIIFVDDISSDKSFEIAKSLLGNTRHKLIQNKTKRLNGGTRNVGIAESSGDYILCIDCDDWFVDNKVLEDINNKLNQEDIMYLGYVMSGYEDKPLILNIKDKTEAFDNPFAAPWLKVVKRELYLKEPFPEGTLYEDRIQNYELVLSSKTFTNLGRPTHYWNRDNQNSITYNPKWKNYRFEYCGEIYRLLEEVQDKEIRQKLINELKMYIKSCNDMVEEL